MTDWDHDGDEDFTDGVIEGIFWFGPWPLVVFICVVSVGIWLYYQ